MKVVTCIILSHYFILLSALKSSIDKQQFHIKRSDFPNVFLFGAATSAYQVEGGVVEDGRSISNWDAFCHVEGNIADGRNADIADDHYHRYLEDIDIMHSLGLTAYRFSISWSRLLPGGRFGGINQAAILFYNKIIDNLLLRGIQPLVTIFHNEFPQEFQDRFGGWLSPLMQEEYLHFADTCFEYFGDRVKYWITNKEPNVYAAYAYEIGKFPPARCSPPFGNCTSGNSDVETLRVVHNMLLAHAKAAKLYHQRFKAINNSLQRLWVKFCSIEFVLFQSKEGGELGITVNAFMFVPMTDDEKDKEAARRALAFNVAWAMDPLVFGDCPPEMNKYHGNELPRFSLDERALLKDSIDFIGINHYGTLYAKDCIHSDCFCDGSNCILGGERAIGGFVYVSGERKGVPIGEQTGVVGCYVVPRGLGDIVDYVKERYHNKAMIIIENGYASLGNEDDDDLLYDVKRVQYHESYLAYLAQSIRNGADVRGYLIWSLMDDFEWMSGHSHKFGLYYIQNQTLNRIPKLSATWYKHFLANFSFVLPTISYQNNIDTL